MSVLIFALAFVSFCLGDEAFTAPPRIAFNHWKAQYNKTYATEAEEALRLQHFTNSLLRVNRLMSGRAGGAKFGLTMFSGMFATEINTCGCGCFIVGFLEL